MPGELRGYRRRWPIRFVLLPVYGVMWVMGIFEGTVSRAPPDPLLKKMSWGRAPLSATTGSARGRLLAIAEGGLMYRLIGKV